MKLLRIISSIDPRSGGPIQGIRNITEELKAAGIITEVVTLDSADSTFGKNDPFVVHSLGKGKTSWNYQKDLRAWLDANLSRFDVVIQHGLWQFQGLALRKAHQQLRKNGGKAPRVYIMPHGMLDPYFQKAESRRLKALRNWLYWKTTESKNIHSADGILFTCEEEKILARTTFTPYKPKDEINIGYGIKAPPPFRIEQQREFESLCRTLNKEPYFLYISRLHEKKGVDMLINAYLALKQSSAKLPKLIIAGPGLETPYGVSLQKLAAGSPDIIFPGMITGDAKWGAFYGCQAFILPSHQENFGIAVVEALACSKPVLISNKINIWREIAEEGGGLVEDDTPAGTSKLLSDWTQLSQDEVADKSHRARRTYENDFSVIESAKRLVERLGA